MSLLEVAGLACGHGKQTVVQGLSLSVEQGDFVAVLGSNNAGKSTFISCLSGVIEARAGSIVFDGQDITAMPAHRRVHHGLVQVPEGRQLFPEMSVRENLRMGAVAGSDPEQTLADVLELFPRLGERMNQRAGSMSGGEQQMVAIGRGLMSSPKLLMLDEPSLGLAPLVVDAIFETLSELNARGMTIVVVEQNLAVSLRHARYGYVLDHGAFAVQGAAESLITSDEARRAYLGL